MDRDHFIIAVYLLVCEHYQALTTQYRLRRGGFTPALTDEEVITIEICGEYFKLACDKDIFAYFHTHYRHFFPHLRDRSLFVRQGANLGHLKTVLHQRLVTVSGQAHDPVQVIDTLPLPVCVITRARRDRCFPLVADWGYCAAKDLHYYGFKLGLRISRCGMIVHFPLLPARPHDIHALDTLLEGFEGLAAADKGFIDAFRQALIAERHGIQVVTSPRKNMTSETPKPLLRFCKRVRKCVETVGSHLTERFGVARIRVHDVWHFQHRLTRKILAHTVCVFLNLLTGRPALDLDGLVSL